MYLAHAGEIHSEVLNHASNQTACIVAASLLAAIVLAVFVILDIRHRRAAEPDNSKK